MSLLPQISEIATSRAMTDVFGGYNHNQRIGEGEFYDMKNMTSDYYPNISPRSQRGVYVSAGDDETIQGIISKDVLYYVKGGVLYKDGAAVSGLTLNQAQKKLVSFGAYILILPDRKWYNTADGTYGDIDAVFDNPNGYYISFYNCLINGEEVNNISSQKTEPINPEDGKYWVDTSVVPNLLKKWSASEGIWKTVATSHIKISCTNIGKKFNVGDGITIDGIKENFENYKFIPNTDTTIRSGAWATVICKVPSTMSIAENAFKDMRAYCNGTNGIINSNSAKYGDNLVDIKITADSGIDFYADDDYELTISTKGNYGNIVDELEKTHIIVAKSDHYIVVEGNLSITFSMAELNATSIIVKRQMPKMDFLVESENRLWGCRYGEQNDVYGTLVSAETARITAGTEQEIEYDLVEGGMESVAQGELAGMRVMCNDRFGTVVSNKATRDNDHSSTGFWRMTIRADHGTDFVVNDGDTLYFSSVGHYNEIYASKLGDFKNWNCFQGVSTDSYAASVGTDGEFTGAISYLGHPIFFKDHCMHKIYGNYPANFQIQTTECRGVEKGSDKSLAMVDEELFYKSKCGICVYDGALPASISEYFGTEKHKDATGGSANGKYYVAMKDKNNELPLFVFDVNKGLWHKEDNLKNWGTVSLHSANTTMNCILRTTRRFAPCLAAGQRKPLPLNGWRKLVSLVLRCRIRSMSAEWTFACLWTSEQGCMCISIRFYGSWEHACTLTGRNLRTFAVPIRPKRCDHLRMRIVGFGDAKIYSITKTIENGSDM